MMFILVCTWFVRFPSLRALFIWTSGNVTSIVSITHTVIFSKQEVSRRRVARGSPGENKCSWNSGKKNNCKLNFFSMYFIRNKEEIHLSFKNSEKIADTSFKKNILWYEIYIENLELTNITIPCLPLIDQKLFYSICMWNVTSDETLCVQVFKNKTKEL